MSDTPASGPIMAFYRCIAIIEQLSTSRMEKALPNGMLPSHFGVLSHLSRVQSGTTPAALANAFQVARPSMTNTIQKLTQQGYVLVTPNPKTVEEKGLAY